MKHNYFFKTWIIALACLCGVGQVVAQQTIRLTTNKVTKGNSNTKKFNIEICVDSPKEITIDWGDGKVETLLIEAVNPDEGTSKHRRHFQDGAQEHTVSIMGDVSYLKVNGQKLKAVDLSKASGLVGLSITSEAALTELDASACVALKKLICNNNGLVKLILPRALTTLNCSNNALGMASLPDLYADMRVEDYIFAPQRPHAIESSLVKGLVVDLSKFTHRKGVLGSAQATEFRWFYADDSEVPATAYSENQGIFTFKAQPQSPIYCTYLSPAFPDAEFQTQPITPKQQQEAASYRFGYSYGKPSAKGSEKAGSKLWYAAGPLFTEKELASFSGDKMTGIRVYLHQDYPRSKVFLRAGLDKSKDNLAEKELDLKAGWNEILFDNPVNLPQDSLLAAYFIRTENKTDVVLAGDKSVFHANHLWEMIQDRQEAPDPSVPFYETTWINSSKDLPAAPVQVLLQGDPSHFENRVTVVGFYPAFYAPINTNGKSEFPILLANRGLNKIENVTVKYAFDRGTETTVVLPLSLEPYEQQTMDGEYLKMALPYDDTRRHLLDLELTAVNDVEGNIMNAKWSQLTQGYHKDKIFPRTPLVETLMSEGDPFAANAEKNITSLLGLKMWTGHNIVRMDYHLGVGDRTDAYELPEMVFDESVGRLAILNGEAGYTPEQETVIPSIMVDRDIMTTYATYLYKGSPFLPILDNNSMAQLLISDAISAPGFAELSIIQKAVDTPKATQFEVSGIISSDVENPEELHISVLLIEEGLVGKQTMFDSFSQDVIENEHFVHAPIVRSFITHPQGDQLRVEADGSYTYKSPEVFLEGLKPDKCKVVAFIHKNSQNTKINNMVLNTTASNVDANKIVPPTSIAQTERNNLHCAIVDRNLVVTGAVKSIELYNAQGLPSPFQNLNSGIYIARIVDARGALHIVKLLCP